MAFIKIIVNNCLGSGSHEPGSKALPHTYCPEALPEATLDQSWNSPCALTAECGPKVK